MRTRAIVTGANGGIGQAIAERLAREGMRVLLVARNEGSLSLVRNAILEKGGQAEIYPADLVVRDAAVRVARKARDLWGGLDVLVNCASATMNADVFSFTDDEWLRAFEVKVFGATRLARETWPMLRESGGSLINICGIGARTPGAEGAMTGALSAALGAITKALADRGVAHGVQVNAINPGLIQTPRIERAWMSGDDNDAEAALHRKIREMRATRVGRPEDVANLVAYIVSGAGEFLQGAIIDLDGGATKAL